MSLLRFVARSLIASSFIADGVKKLTQPSDSAEEVENFTSKVTPLVQRVVPAGYSSWVPERPETWVKVAGGTQIIGGAMFATGIGRRLGAVLLAATSVLNIASALPGKGATKSEKEQARPRVLTNLALLGTTVLAAADTQGKPSLSWRAQHSIARLEKNVGKKTKAAGKKAKAATKRLTA